MYKFRKNSFDEYRWCRNVSSSFCCASATIRYLFVTEIVFSLSHLVSSQSECSHRDAPELTNEGIKEDGTCLFWIDGSDASVVQ